MNRTIVNLAGNFQFLEMLSSGQMSFKVKSKKGTNVVLSKWGNYCETKNRTNIE